MQEDSTGLPRVRQTRALVPTSSLSFLISKMRKLDCWKLLIFYIILLISDISSFIKYLLNSCLNGLM